MAAKAAVGRELNRPRGRLKKIRDDPLENLGLPSKGDNRHADTEATRQSQELMAQ